MRVLVDHVILEVDAQVVEQVADGLGQPPNRVVTELDFGALERTLSI